MPSLDPGDGLRLHYRDTGDGRPVLLLHGWACHGGYFQPQHRSLAGCFRLVVPDLRGHRHSHRAGERPDLAALSRDVAALLDHLGLRDTVVVGWSMGALVAFELLKGAGSRRIGGLVIEDMSPRLLAAPDWDLGLSGRYDERRADRVTATIRQDWERYVEAFLPSVFATGRDPDPGLMAWMDREMRSCDPAAMAALWQSMAEADHRSMLEGIAVPTLVMRGSGSQLYGEATARHLAARIPSARLVTVADAGHAPHLEQPEAFNRALSGFIDGL